MKKNKSLKTHNQHKNQPQEVDQIPRRRLWLFRLAAIIVFPVIFFSLLENTLRLFQFGYPSSALVERETDSANYIHENSAFAYRFFPKRLAREFTPLRFQAEKPDGVFRIFILGGSAAQGTPDAAYSFGRILEVMLQIRYPETKFEILSLAMPAINSHVVLEIAKDCREYDPDLFIVYMGNNEVIGPYGPGTLLTPIFSNISLLRLGIKLKATKISQLLSMGMEKLSIVDAPYKRWEGMEMFLRNQVRLNDPGLETTYKNFALNLEQLTQISRDHDIKIIYSTVAGNLKDCSPFNSVHRTDIKQDDLRRWEELYATASALEVSGAYIDAIEKYTQALKIDNQYADLHYKLGRCYWNTGNFPEAAESYELAREYDANRFRADNRINEIIRQKAATVKGTTFLADALSEIEQRSPHGIPGNEFLLEHVHLNFEGNYVIARTILNQIDYVFPEISKEQGMEGAVRISDSLCAVYLAYNNYEKHQILELVLNGFIKQPPFTNQLYHSETVKNLENEIDSLQAVIRIEGRDHILNTYEEALLKRPSDWLLHYKYAGYLSDDSVRMYNEAVKHYQFVLKEVSHDPNTYVMLGSVMGKQGRLQESLDLNQQALNIDPTLAKAYFNYGLICQKLKRYDIALENYGKAISYDPVHSKAYNNMAYIYSKQGNISKVMETIEQGLKAVPDDVLLNYNRAMYLYKYGRKAEAIEQLRHVTRIAPDETTIQSKLQQWLKEEE